MVSPKVSPVSSKVRKVFGWPSCGDLSESDLGGQFEKTQTSERCPRAREHGTRRTNSKPNF